MNSLAWPNMFSANGSDTLLVTDSAKKAATLSNLKLLLSSEKLSIFGDPYYGVSIRKFLFEPNSSVLMDLLADEICTCINMYMPQVSISRNDIYIDTDTNQEIVRLQILVHYNIDNTTDLFTIDLTNNLQEG